MTGVSLKYFYNKNLPGQILIGFRFSFCFDIKLFEFEAD